MLLLRVTKYSSHEAPVEFGVHLFLLSQAEDRYDKNCCQ